MEVSFNMRYHVHFSYLDQNMYVNSPIKDRTNEKSWLENVWKTYTNVNYLIKMQQVLFRRMDKNYSFYYVNVYLIPYEHYEAHMNAKVKLASIMTIMM